MGPLAAFAIPAVGSAVGGLFSKLFGGGGKKKDEFDQDFAKTLAGLNDSSAGFTAKGNEFDAVGMEQLRPVLEIFRQLAGGDPEALADATRPERSRVIDQYDTARKTISEFGPRGGGTNALLGQSQFDQASELSNITALARRNALDTSANLGTTLSGLGLTADQLASADLNTIIQAILSRQGLKTQERGQNSALAGGIAEGLGTLLGLFLTKGSSAGSGASS